MTTSPDVISKPAPVPATDIKKAQLAYVYQQTPALLLYASLATIGLTIVVRLHIDNTVLITWTLTSLAIIAFRYFLYKEYRKNPGNRTGNIWAWSLTVLVALSGITWGVGSFLLFVPHHLGSQAILFMILVGIAVIPTVIMSVYLPLLYLFLPAVTIPAGIALFTLGEDFHVYPGAFFLVLTAGMIMVGRHINNDFRDRLILDTTNSMLVRKLQEQKGELERANSAKTKFLALASHDLRQPLHALSIYSDLLVRHHRTNSCPDTTDKRLNMLTDKIGSSVHTLDQLFAALLDVSRLDAQEMPKHITVFQPKEIIEQVLSDCEPAAAKKNITLTADINDDYTESDPVLLFRLLLNLVNNAIKFTQAGSVTICCRPVSGYLQLSVKDTGIGIAPDQQKRIFEEFYQLNDNPSDNSEGLGLGLSIVKGIAELLEHPLELDSEPGRGTTLTLMLPLREPPQQITPEQITGPHLSDRCNQLEVLVIEDAPELLVGMQLLLTSWGCSVQAAANSEQALKIAANSASLNAIIADFNLPGSMDGLELIKTLRESCDAEIPAVLITGERKVDLIDQAEELGVEFIHKPLKAAELKLWLVSRAA